MLSPVADALAALAAVLDAFGVRWYLFGAQAALVYGAVRLTADIDATLELADRDLGELVAHLRTAGFVLRIQDFTSFVERTRVLPTVHEASGMAVDLVLAGPGLEEQFLDHAQRQLIEGVAVPVASAEDIVIMKLIAGRAKDVDDVIAILGTHPQLDLLRIREILRQVEQALDRSDLLAALDDAIQRTRE
jgi:uncharacterized nucleotidyltransferase DUF6036